MAKKHKNLDNIPIQWDGDLSKPSDGSAQSSPDSVELGAWGGKNTPCWYDVIDDGSCSVPAGCGLYSECEAGIPLECRHESNKCFSHYGLVTSLYFEDFDISGTGDVGDYANWLHKSSVMFFYQRSMYDTSLGGFNIFNPIVESANYTYTPPYTTNYTWDDVSFVIEIADGLGTGGRRAREARLHKFDKDTKRRLIHLICRVKGEKVYDEEKVVGDIQIKLEDADLVIERVLGKMIVENANVL